MSNAPVCHCKPPPHWDGSANGIDVDSSFTALDAHIFQLTVKRSGAIVVTQFNIFNPDSLTTTTKICRIDLLKFEIEFT